MGDGRGAECRAILAEALALEDQLPTSWFEVWDRVSALERRGRQGVGPTRDFSFLCHRLGDALPPNSMTFPREFW